MNDAVSLSVKYSAFFGLKIQNSKLKNGKEMIQRMKVEENPES